MTSGGKKLTCCWVELPTACNWMGRYIERTENMARLVDTGLRLALTHTESSSDEWSSVLTSAGVLNAYRERHDEFTAEMVADFLLRGHGQRIRASCLRWIRRAPMRALVRTALTRETWESINEAWMSLKRMLATPDRPARIAAPGLDAIKRETALIRGAFHGTMLRNEIFDFTQLGIFIERGRQHRRASSTSNITCFCRRWPGSDRLSTITSGNRSCGRYPPTEPTGGSMRPSTSRKTSPSS